MKSKGNRYRAEEKAVLVWNGECGRTAYISGKELLALRRWTDGETSGFSERLTTLGLIRAEDRKRIRRAIDASVSLKAPHHAFCAPESLHVELTARCGLRCPQCYKALSEAELSLDVVMDVIRQADELGVFQIALGGGEPMLYPFLNDVIREISNRGMACSLTTSGYDLNEVRLNEMLDKGLDHVQVSLNGSTQSVHEKSRDGYALAVHALQVLKDKPVSHGINWVARMDNIDDLPAVLELAREYGAGNLNILRYKPSAAEVFKQVDLTEEKLPFLADVIRGAKGISIEVDSAFSNLLCHLNGQAGMLTGCGAGRRFLAVDAEGWYRPCSHVEWRERGKSLADTWRHSEILSRFRHLEENIGEPCRDCAWMQGCRGCRAIAEKRDGDFYAGDGNCHVYREKRENKWN